MLSISIHDLQFVSQNLMSSLPRQHVLGIVGAFNHFLAVRDVWKELDIIMMIFQSYFICASHT